MWLSLASAGTLLSRTKDLVLIIECREFVEGVEGPKPVSKGSEFFFVRHCLQQTRFNAVASFAESAVLMEIPGDVLLQVLGWVERDFDGGHFLNVEVRDSHRRLASIDLSVGTLQKLTKLSVLAGVFDGLKIRLDIFNESSRLLVGLFEGASQICTQLCFRPVPQRRSVFLLK